MSFLTAGLVAEAIVSLFVDTIIYYGSVVFTYVLTRYVQIKLGWTSGLNYWTSTALALAVLMSFWSMMRYPLLLI